VPFLIKAFHDPKASVRRAAFGAIARMDAEPQVVVPPLVEEARTRDGDEGAVISDVVAEIAGRAQDRDDIRSLDALSEAQEELSSAGATNRNSFLVIQRSVRYLKLLRGKTGVDTPYREKIQFQDPIPPELVNEPAAIVNGAAVQVGKSIEGDGALVFLGDKNPFNSGINWIESSKGSLHKKFALWYEGKRLQRYSAPYAKSYAIIAAIDDYSGSVSGRKSSDFRSLTNMVRNARALASLLLEYGFNRQKILEFYDKEATSVNFEQALRRFWKTKDGPEIDRLLVYFGGHGATNESSTPCLVTYDYDSDSPGLTGFLMRDIVQRHFENINSHHVAVFLDACYTGLALPPYWRLADVSAERKRLQQFRALSIIESETREKARNIVVSGTADQNALWEDGGVFTEALISGLRGSADLNQDGVIELDELTLFIRDEVRVRARQAGERQEPRQWSDNTIGSGSVVFVKQPGEGK
jgi:hypothetical protein